MRNLKLQLTGNKELVAVDVDTNEMFENIVSVTVYKYHIDRMFRGSITIMSPYSHDTKTINGIFVKMELIHNDEQSK